MGEWRVVVENYRESVWENGNILNMDGGDDLCNTVNVPSITEYTLNND